MHAQTQRLPKIPISVLVVIHSPEMEVLMLERADRPGYWQSVTGSLDALDEPPAQACVREVQEETGIEVASVGVHLTDWHHHHDYEILPHWRHRYGPGVTRNTEHVFSLEVPRDIGVQVAPREHLQFRWLPWPEAAQACFSPSNAEAIRELAQRRGMAAGVVEVSR